MEKPSLDCYATQANRQGQLPEVLPGQSHESAALGLPAPVRKLLETLEDIR